ncbi:fumarylacetoacetate hydrolase family protein [Vibrio sp. Of7-15]|uniref:fumarylacetoacetate hydrolase family protein n=1 Tax=Vibrio sp. Of7-15 TaxID=2724879 RepID=UPI001EF29BF4|nr:fumarylacetoacetate hydrolase family protein [Vibrio sp. Of7-15]MCG7498094.1 fumarylacetoacetate hydrolase family protein [Vibrio sp. Of7-15]
MNQIQLETKQLTPSKVVCVGRNYVDHIKELNNDIPEEIVLFIKPNSSISPKIYAGTTDPIHYEGEICYLIQAGEITAVGIGLDLTKREIQSQLKSKGLPWERAKCFDKSAVFSHFVPFHENLTDLRLELSINDQLVQLADSTKMINKPNQILEETKSFLTLEDGDVIMSGTPKGVGIVKKGDVFHGKLFTQHTLLIEHSWTVK